MSTRTWQNLSGDFANSNGNWGTAIVDGDSALMPKNDYDITTTITALGAKALVDLLIGNQFTHSLGAPGAPATAGTCTGKLEIDAPLSSQICISPTAWPTAIVKNCSSQTYGVFFVAGAVTELIVSCAGRVRVGTGMTITRIRMNSGTLDIERGATITDIEQGGGIINDYAGFSGVHYGNGGTYDLIDDQAVTTASLTGIGTFRGGPGWRGRIIAKCTIANIKGNGAGVLDFGMDGRPKIVTNGTIQGGFALRISNSIVTASNAIVIDGGQLTGNFAPGSAAPTFIDLPK